VRSIQIVHSIENEASGPSYSVMRLAEALAVRGLRSELFSLAEQPGNKNQQGVSLQSFPSNKFSIPLVSRLGFSTGLRNALFKAARGGAVLHGHGLWRMPTVYPGRVAARTGAPMIHSPRGMFGGAALAFSAKQKYLFWKLAQGKAIEPVSCFHATSQAELEEIRSFGLEAPVAIIPNGIDVPDIRIKKTSTGKRTVLYLGRIHPKKGIDQLLRSWSLTEQDHCDWHLRIVGPSEKGHTEELKALASELNISRARFDGPLYGNEKHEAYAAADLFVLPTLNENFGLVVAEALAQGTPVISTKGAPWEGLEHHHCGWWVGHGPEAIAGSLCEAMRQPPETLTAMGERGRAWVLRDFSWEGVAEQMEGLYRWCSDMGDKPDFVEK